MAMTPYFDDGGGRVIYHGDCREVLADFRPDDFAAAVFDPPYGIAFATNFTIRGKGASWMNATIQNDSTTEIRDWVVTWCEALPMLVFGTWKRPKPIGTHTVLVWNKGPASGMGDLSIPWKASWEEIYVIGRGFSGSRDEGVISGLTGVTWESKGRSHPNEKPPELLQYLLGKCPNGTVLDPTMGSGTTILAAKVLGRPAIGIELEEKYCEAAAKRLEQEMLPFTPRPPKQVQVQLFGGEKP